MPRLAPMPAGSPHLPLTHSFHMKIIFVGVSTIQNGLSRCSLHIQMQGYSTSSHLLQEYRYKLSLSHFWPHLLCLYILQTFHVAPNLKLDFGKSNFICVQVHLIPCFTPCLLGVIRLNLLLQPSRGIQQTF